MSRILLALVGAAVVAGVALMPEGALFTRTPVDDYGLQTQAYLSGRLALLEPPSREVLALPNPWTAGRDAGSARPDVALYQGRYYVYFGVAPIVTLLAPVRLVTGWWMRAAVGCVLFALAGVGLALALIDEVRRAVAPDLPRSLRATILAGVTLGSGLTLWLAEPGVYQLAQASGWCWLMAMLWSGARALRSPRPLPWLAGASAAFGLAVASRPTLILAGVAVPIFAAALRGRLPWSRLAAAALVPAAIVGGALAGLNLARFGSPLEFGMRYNLSNWGDTRDFPFFSPGYVRPNLLTYLLATPDLSAGMPPLAVGWRASVGLIALPLVWLAAGVVRLPRPARPVGIAALATTVAVFLPLLFFCVSWSRYEVDFLAPAVVTAALGVIALHATLPEGAARRLASAAMVCAAIQALSVSAMFFETLP